MNVLSVKNLTKKIKNKIILNNISLEIEEGDVVGLIGPNGAGKTSLIKTILGLYRYQDGHIQILGYDLQKDFEKALRKTGAIVENPDMYSYLTGEKNLQIYCNLHGVPYDDYVKRIVKLVKLENRIKDKIKTYSLGMRQRLGLAQSLLNKPKFLILDEPTNGLDPLGIIELREIIKEINVKENITILIASHMLSEIENICTKVAIIDNGRIIEMESINKLKDNTFKLEDEFIRKTQGSKEQIR